MVLSQYTGWVTIDEQTGLNRKNAPEVLKVPQTESFKMKFKPTWMEKNLDDLAKYKTVEQNDYHYPE